MPFAVAAGIGAAGSLASGIMTSNASKNAAQTQANAANQATALEQQMYDQTRTDLSPYMDAGTNALAAYQKMIGLGPGGSGPTSPIMQMLGIGPNGQPTGSGIDPSTFQASPGYQYQLQQTMDAVTNANAAHGGMGGNALKALQSNASGLANNSWQQYLQNVNAGWQGLTSQVGGLAGAGQNAATNLGTASMNLGREMGENAMGAGNALASGIMGGNNALMGGIGGAVNSIGGYLTGSRSPVPGWLNGPNANQSAAYQYANPYGATGNGMAPIVGMNGMMGGGV